MADDDFKDEVSELNELDEQHAKHKELDALDALELKYPHKTPAYIIEQMDNEIAGWRAREHSRLDESEEYPKDNVRRILKGDAGEGYTHVRLLDRYEREQIMPQPKGITDREGNVKKPDFVVKSQTEPAAYEEIVDAKAWSLLRPREEGGEKISYTDFMRSLRERPNPARLVDMSKLKKVVNQYASSPQLASDGRVVLYFPEDTLRYAPQLKQEIEGWSGSELAHGRTVEVRSIGIWNDDLWQAAGKRHQR